MKKALLWISLVVGLLWGCRSDAPTEYSHVVPASVNELVVVHLHSLMEKAGMTGELGQALLQQATALLLDGYPAFSDELLALQKEKVGVGIDWEKPAYLFPLPGQHVAAIALCIHDMERWESVVERLVKAQVLTAPEKGRQCRRTVLTAGRMGLYYNQGTLLMLLADGSEPIASLHGKADELLAQTEEQSIHAHQYYDALMKQVGDIRLMATPESLPFDLRGILKYPSGTPLLGHLLFDAGRIEAEVGRAGFEGESSESDTPFRPSNSMELQGAMMAIMHGRPFHIELGYEELLTISNIGVMMEYAPDDPQLSMVSSLISQVQSLTLRGDTNRSRFVLSLHDKSQNALKQLVDFVQKLFL